MRLHTVISRWKSDGHRDMGFAARPGLVEVYREQILQYTPQTHVTETCASLLGPDLSRCALLLGGGGGARALSLSLCTDQTFDIHSSIVNKHSSSPFPPYPSVENTLYITHLIENTFSNTFLRPLSVTHEIVGSVTVVKYS